MRAFISLQRRSDVLFCAFTSRLSSTTTKMATRPTANLIFMVILRAGEHHRKKLAVYRYGLRATFHFGPAKDELRA